MTVSRHIEMGGAPERWRVDLGFTAGSPEQLMEFSQKIFPIARRLGIGWEGGPVTSPAPNDLPEEGCVGGPHTAGHDSSCIYCENARLKEALQVARSALVGIRQHQTSALSKLDTARSWRSRP